MNPKWNFVATKKHKWATSNWILYLTTQHNGGKESLKSSFPKPLEKTKYHPQQKAEISVNWCKHVHWKQFKKHILRYTDQNFVSANLKKKTSKKTKSNNYHTNSKQSQTWIEVVERTFHYSFQNISQSFTNF